jgi:hypothetical protein
MPPSLRALLSHLIDYAGLFPPAKLPLEQAIRNYATYRSCPEAWMLGRFICPAARLSELRPFVTELFAGGPPLAVSALGRGGNTLVEFAEGLLADAGDVEAFRQAHPGRVTVDVLETRVAPDLVEPANRDVGETLHQLLLAVRQSGLAVFCEAPADPRKLLAQLRPAKEDEPAVGFKLRCGGLDAKAFPAARLVAEVLHTCLRGGLPFKATAGLHHPLPRFDPAVGATMHGFVNLFTAGVLAQARKLRFSDIRFIIQQSDPSAFAFTDEGLRYGEHHATTEEIQAARRAVVSFGSCSFDEPRDDLRALGWL